MLEQNWMRCLGWRHPTGLLVRWSVSDLQHCSLRLDMALSQGLCMREFRNCAFKFPGFYFSVSFFFPPPRPHLNSGQKGVWWFGVLIYNCGSSGIRYIDQASPKLVAIFAALPLSARNVGVPPSLAYSIFKLRYLPHQNQVCFLIPWLSSLAIYTSVSPLWFHLDPD